MQISSSFNSSSFCGSFKGFLYKIKHPETGKTHGYLLGTLHKTEGLEMKLHERIYRSIFKSSVVCTEITEFDKTKMSSQEADSFLESIITDKNRGTEDLLVYAAQEKNIPVIALETLSSRYAINDSILKEQLYVSSVKVLGEWIMVRKAAQYLSKVASAPDVKTAFDELLNGCHALVDAIKAVSFSGNSSLKDRSPEQFLFVLVERYGILLEKFGFDDEILSSLKGLFLNQMDEKKQMLEERSKLLDERSKLIGEAWKNGDKAALETCIKVGADKNPCDRRINELEDQEMYARDTHMLAGIEKQLAAAKGERCFFAVGSAHLLGNYENLKVRLEKKGWKLVNSYGS